MRKRSPRRPQNRSIVVAFGGNALLREQDHGTDLEQARNADSAARVLVDLIRRRYSLLIVHGNGPQVGNLLIQMEEGALKVPPSGLDTGVAMSQGSIGYLLERSLTNQLHRRHIACQVVTLMTMVLVSEDPSSLEPTKPVGPFLSRHRATELKRRGTPMIEDAGRGWRRVVPSPRPVEVLNAGMVKTLLAAGHVVIAGGGGGIPVRRGPTGLYHGVEAVIDKDRTAALLARSIGATELVLLTDVAHVSLFYGSERERALTAVGASELERWLEQGEFAVGSMGPKIEASLDFLRGGGREAIVTDSRSLRAALAGRAGTRIHRDRFD